VIVWTRRRTKVLGSAVMVIILLSAVGCAQTTAPAGGLDGTTTRSALIFGTNLSLYDTNDQVVNNDATQQLLKQAHVPIIRMPFRFSLSDAYVTQALQAIKRVGAVPLVIIHGPTDPNALPDDRALIALTQAVFGEDIVYVEFGNEADLAGVAVWRYIESWNAVIPSLKVMAPTYKFVGPVNFQFDPTYLATFDRYANPRPDVNSWHEYVCYPYSSNDYCVDHLADWTAHIRQANEVVRATIGTTLPTMITEWNLDAAPDARYADGDFMQAWTAKALETFTNAMPLGLMGAMHYCVTNNVHFDLIDASNVPTPQGRTLFRLLASATLQTSTIGERIGGVIPPNGASSRGGEFPMRLAQSQQPRRWTALRQTQDGRETV
jgi:hypothetical protein